MPPAVTMRSVVAKSESLINKGAAFEDNYPQDCHFQCYHELWKLRVKERWCPMSPIQFMWWSRIPICIALCKIDHGKWWFQRKAAKAGGGAKATLYDDMLKDAAFSHYGTLKVYKSGKTEFVLGSPNGWHVAMQVMEGVRPSFYQQALVMDMEASKFVPLGDMKWSVVVIPSLEHVFS